ncbi:hypothetical protein [Gordonia aurantiaca]|uniref:hypothetical protein n=1 Tax=Gordonia sp. B21 TaxID=3151852 RepID=UPI0032658786
MKTDTQTEIDTSVETDSTENAPHTTEVETIDPDAIDTEDTVDSVDTEDTVDSVDTEDTVDSVDEDAATDAAPAESSSGGTTVKKTAVKKKSIAKKSPKTSDADGTDDAANRPVGRKPTGFGWRRVGVGLLAVFAIAAATLAIVFGVQLKNRVDIENAGQEALRTAKDYAVTLTSIDTRNLDRDFQRVLDGATGEFKDMYASSSQQLRQLLVDNQATGKGVVIDAGIKSQAEDKVQVMLFVDQTVTNTATPDPRLDRSRIVMTMEKVDGRWLASKVELP